MPKRVSASAIPQSNRSLGRIVLVEIIKNMESFGVMTVDQIRSEIAPYEIKNSFNRCRRVFSSNRIIRRRN
jgi:hypothetical protein